MISRSNDVYKLPNEIAPSTNPNPSSLFFDGTFQILTKCMVTER